MGLRLWLGMSVLCSAPAWAQDAAQGAAVQGAAVQSDSVQATRPPADETAPAQAGGGTDAPAAAAPDVSTLSDAEQAEVLLDKNDPRAKAGVVVGARGIDPGWKDSRVAERSPNLWGQTGLLRTNSALAGKAGYFDIALHGQYFTAPNFILAQYDDDANTLAAANITFGVTLFDLLELGVGTRAVTNENTRAVPVTSFSTGDVFASAKVGGAVWGPVALGLDLRGYVPSAADAVGPDFGQVSLTTTGLFTFDGYGAYGWPFRAHLNVGYAYEFDEFIVNQPENQLAVFTAQTWYWHQLVYGAGVEFPLPYVTPFVEFSGRHAIGVDPSSFARGPREYGLSDAHMYITPGARVSVGRGLHFDMALDWALGGRDIVYGQPVAAPWMAQLGVSYTFSPFVAETQVEIRETGAPTGFVAGCVVDAASTRAVQEAYVEFAGSEGPRIVVDDAGCFQSPRLVVGEQVIRVKHPDYKAGEVTVAVSKDATSDVQVKLAPAPRYGQFKGLLLDLKDRPVTGSLKVTNVKTGEVTTLAAEDGAFTSKLGPGRYQVLVEAGGYLSQGARVLVEPLGRTIRDFVLKPIPKKRVTVLKKGKIEITTKIPFQYNKSRLLRAASFILDDVVDVILRNPQLTSIRVGGHTDNTGEAKYNQKLSEARAQTVMDYLIQKGVAAERLTAVGYGFSQPLASNDTEEGRAENRRVEFVIVGQDGQ